MSSSSTLARGAIARVPSNSGPNGPVITDDDYAEFFFELKWERKVFFIAFLGLLYWGFVAACVGFAIVSLILFPVWGKFFAFTSIALCFVLAVRPYRWRREYTYDWLKDIFVRLGNFSQLGGRTTSSGKILPEGLVRVRLVEELFTRISKRPYMRYVWKWWVDRHDLHYWIRELARNRHDIEKLVKAGEKNFGQMLAQTDIHQVSALMKDEKLPELITDQWCFVMRWSASWLCVIFLAMPVVIPLIQFWLSRR